MLPVHQSESLPMVRKPRATPKMPRYLSWRNGRPRWQPGPMLRNRGYQGRDLKYDSGEWMKLWDACEAAEAINKAVDGGVATIAQRPQARTLNALFDHIEALPKFRDDAPADVGPGARRKTRRLSKDTRAGYIGHFRIARAWAGDLLIAAITPADAEIYYDAMVEERGHVMANRNVAALNMAYNIAIDKLQWASHNPFKKIELVPEDGRQVMWDADENLTFIRCADWMGLPGVGDAHVVGLLSAQSRIDVLAMPELDLAADVFRLPRHKVSGTTKAVAYVPATQLLVARLRLARERKEKMFPGVTYRHEIIDYSTGAPYNLEGSRFTEQHRAVRAVASGLQWALEEALHLPWSYDYANMPFQILPSIWSKRFQDLRDTAFTLMLEATNGDIAKVANFTAHSLRTVQKVADKHYFVRREGMSRGAGGQLEQLMKRIGYAG